MIRFTVPLEQDEREALRVLARQERRDPRDQAAVLIRKALECRGLLPSEPAKARQEATA